MRHQANRMTGELVRPHLLRADPPRAQAPALRSLWALLLGFVAAALLCGIALGMLLASSSASKGAVLADTLGAVSAGPLERAALLLVLGTVFVAMLTATLGLWRQAAEKLNRPARRTRDLPSDL